LQQSQTANRGELLVSLCWQPATRRVTVVVLKARNLPKMDLTGLAGKHLKKNNFTKLKKSDFIINIKRLISDNIIN